MLKGIYILHERAAQNVYGPQERAEISELVDLVSPQSFTSEAIKDNLALMKDVDVIFSSWGAPRLDAEFLNASPNLKAIFYGAGSVKSFVTDEFWERDIAITSAWAANAVPVAEYTLAQITLSLKRFFWMTREVKHNRRYVDSRIIDALPAAYGSTVGLVSLGMIGRLVVEKLKSLNVEIIAYDPFVSEEEAESLGVSLVSLNELFERADVVSLHTPWLKETEKMIGKDQFSRMKRGATFINTARGAVVNEQDLITVFRERTDLQALLDVTYPEPPPSDSPLYILDNVLITPHIAGSTGPECRRMAAYMIEELKRFINNEPLKWGLTKQKAAILA